MASGIRIPLISDWDPSGVNKAKRDFAKLETTGQKASYALKKAFVPATVALAGIGAAAGAFINAGERAATSNARIEQITKSMGLAGAASGELGKKLVEMADAQALATGEDQNAIKLGMAKLLTFSAVAKSADEMGGVFERTTQLSLDLAAAGFGTVSDNATQLGKALQDPIKGLSALARSGVTFTAQEKELIRTLVESGKTLEAQEMILGAIEAQVGGTAAATRNATDRMKVGFSLLSEQIGLALLPVLDALLPVFMGLVEFAGDHTNVIIGVGAAIAGIAAAIVIANVAMRAWKIATAVATAAQWLWNAALTANPIGLVVVAIAAVIAIVIVLQKKFDIFGKAVAGLKWIFDQLWDGVKWVFEKIIDGINFLIAAWNKLPLVPDIEEIDKSFLHASETVEKQSVTIVRSMEEVAEVVGSAEVEAGRFRNQLEAVGEQADTFSRIDTPKLTQGIEGFSDEVSIANQNLRVLYDTLKREDAVDAFQSKIDDMVEALGTDEFEGALRDAKLAVFDLEQQVGGFSSAIATEFQLAIDTQDIEYLNLLILSIRENWSGFTSSDIPNFANLNLDTLDPFRQAIGNLSPDLSAALANQYRSGIRSSSSSTNVVVNVQGADPNATVKALEQYVRQNGAVPVVTTANRRT